MKCSGCPATISKKAPGTLFFFVGYRKEKIGRRFFCRECQKTGRVQVWMDAVGKSFIHRVKRTIFHPFEQSPLELVLP